MWLMIMLKVTKHQGYTLSLEDTFSEKQQGRGRGRGQIIHTLQSLFRVNVFDS